MEDKEKKLLIFGTEDGEYYQITNFIEFLKASEEEYIDYTYVTSKFHVEFLKNMKTLEERGIVSKGFVDDDGEFKEVGIEETEEDMNFVIESIQNTIDEYVDLFDEERIEKLDKLVQDAWERMSPEKELGLDDDDDVDFFDYDDDEI